MAIVKLTEHQLSGKTRYGKKINEKLDEVIDQVNNLTDGSISTTDLTLTGDLVVGDDADVVGDFTAGTIASDAGVSGTRLTSGAGTVTAPGVVVGVTDNGLYEVSASQLGVSVGNTLVGGFNSTGAFTDVISEQTTDVGVTIDGLVIRDNRIEYNSTGYFGVTKTADTTLTIDETGFIFGNKGTALVLTLPATVVGYSYFIVNINGAATIALSPNSSDYIGGAGLTKTDDKDLIIPAVKGAYAQIIADGVNGWYIAQASGTLTKEA